MTDNKANEYASCSKKVWVIYVAVIVLLIIFLAAVVAQDNEERLFYSLMAAAAAYVFRPTDRVIGNAVMKLFGVARPEAK